MDAAEVAEALASGRISVRRSARRRKTISVRRDGTGYLLAVPASYDIGSDLEGIGRLIARIEARSARTRGSDADLHARAEALSAQYFDDGILPVSVRWSSDQRQRFASATSAHRTIRVSDRLRGVPEWVLDGVLIHELAHLREPNHSAAFRRLTARYPKTDLVEAFLDGFSFGERTAEPPRRG